MDYTESATDKVVRILCHAERPPRTRDMLETGIHARDLYALRDAGGIRAVMRGMHELFERDDQMEHTRLTGSLSRYPLPFRLAAQHFALCQSRRVTAV